MAATFEIINGMLFVTGSLDRSSDQEFTQALERYAEGTAAHQRVVDMSNVRWLAPTGAKALIASGQDAIEKKGQLRILASRHVLQTLNLLGAKSWLTVESCMTPNAKPGAEESAAAPPSSTSEAPGTPSNTESSESPQAMAPASAATTPLSQNASTSGAMSAVKSGPLAGSNEELSRGGHILRVLYPSRRYSFHFPDGGLIIGLVRERVGGSWVIVETSATRKIINLDMVAYCEIL